MADIIIGNVKGPQGETGQTGPQGAPGTAATVNVGTVTTTVYGNPAQVTNSGTASAAVLDFVIPQGAPGSEVTDVSSLTVDSITETAASFPVPAVGEVMSVTLGKIVKFFGDTVTALGNKFDKANVANNLTTADSGYALDARQGTALKGLIDTINSIFDTAEYKILQRNSAASDNNTIMTGQAAQTVKIYWGQNETNAPATNSLHLILSARYGSYGQQFAFYANRAYFRGWSEGGGFSDWNYIPVMVTATTTGTTSAQGNLQINSNGNLKVVCATSGNKICLPFLSGFRWFVKVFDTSMNLQANTEATIEYTYFV